jgi:hypothetical protein
MGENLLDNIITRIPDDAALARRLYFIIKMLNWANKLVCTVLLATQQAQQMLLAKSGTFAATCKWGCMCSKTARSDSLVQSSSRKTKLFKQHATR